MYVYGSFYTLNSNGEKKRHRNGFMEILQQTNNEKLSSNEIKTQIQHVDIETHEHLSHFGDGVFLQVNTPYNLTHF